MNDVMNEVRNNLYKKYKFIEPSLYEFEKIIFEGLDENDNNTYSYVIDKAKTNISNYIISCIKNSKFSKLFENAYNVIGIDDAFEFYGKFIAKHAKEIGSNTLSDEDMEELIQNPNYTPYYENLIKKHKKTIENDDYTFISSKLLQDILETVYLGMEFEEDKFDYKSYLSDSQITDYIKEIGNFNVLTKIEEQDAFRRLAEGDETVKDYIIEHNLKLAFSIAKKKFRKSRCLTEMDLIQLANMGVIKAVEKFDYKKGTKFSTYATWWIRQSINRGVSETDDLVRIPVNTRDKFNKFTILKHKFEEELQREATEEELKDYLGISQDALDRFNDIDTLLTPTSIDVKVGEDEESTLADFIKDEDAKGTDYDAFLNSVSEMNEILLNKLDEREQDILKLRMGYYDDKCYTLEEIGKMYNVTRERIRQIESRAIRKLKKYAKRMYPDVEMYDELKQYHRKENKEKFMDLVGLRDDYLFDAIFMHLTDYDQHVISKFYSNNDLSLEETIRFNQIVDSFRTILSTYDNNDNSVIIYGKRRKLGRVRHKPII